MAKPSGFVPIAIPRSGPFDPLAAVLRQRPHPLSDAVRKAEERRLPARNRTGAPCSCLCLKEELSLLSLPSFPSDEERGDLHGRW